MKFNELQADRKKNPIRSGRGISGKRGKTCGRGTKGQNSRTGHKHYATFMGGQGPLLQRIPKKHGFKSLRVPAQVVYTDLLSEFDGKVADNATLFDAGLIATPYHSVKIILRGELKGKVAVKTQGASKGAQEAIKKAGGSFEQTETPHLPASEKKQEKEN